MKWPVNKQTSL